MHTRGGRSTGHRVDYNSETLPIQYPPCTKQYDVPAAEDANSASAIHEESKEQEARGTAVDSEDEDDEPNESGCDSSQDQEPIPDDMEIAFVQDEAAAIIGRRALRFPRMTCPSYSISILQSASQRSARQQRQTPTPPPQAVAGGNEKRGLTTWLVCNKLNLTPIRMVNHLQLLGDGQPCI